MGYGLITRRLSDGTAKELEVENFIQGYFPNGRTITIAEIEDGSMALIVENPPESGRNPRQSMSLTRESYEALMAFAMMHEVATGNRMQDNAESINGVEYKCSDNIKL